MPSGKSSGNFPMMVVITTPSPSISSTGAKFLYININSIEYAFTQSYRPARSCEHVLILKQAAKTIKTIEALRTYLRWNQWLINEFEHRIHKGVQHFCRSVLEDFGDIYMHGNLLHSSQEWLLLVISTLINRVKYKYKPRAAV